MLIALNNVTFEFGARTIVEDANWHIGNGERIGLIGLNGTGKSTLLRIINNEYSVSGGTIDKINGLTIGFFNQDLLSFSSDAAIREVAKMGFARALELERELVVITEKMEKDPENEKLIHDYSDTLHEFEVAGGYEMDHRSEQVLEGLGFSTADLQKPFSQFSGGWRMRVMLARMILQHPDVLMLDEPTNHLDLPSIEWLEKYLEKYDGTVIIVSHDRFFLDRMVTKIVELFQQQLHFYGGNYTFYEQEKVIRADLQQRQFENQQEYIRQQERFIERFKAKATKATQAQSAMKRLDKLDRVEAPTTESAKIRMNFTIEQQPGKILYELNHVSKRFGENIIVEDTGVEIERGEKIALIGANGRGKSTMLRIIADTEEFDGERREGYNIKASFYAQHQLESLNVDNNLLQELMLCGSGKTELELRQILGCFLFSGDDVFKKIKVLSGGEKARVALAKTIISKANFLLLDEPTNHLDMNSVNMLIEALNQYQGSYIIVSHDRHFIKNTANTIWEIVDHKIKVFKDGYPEWEEWKRKQQLAATGGGKKKESAAKLAAPVVEEKKPAADPQEHRVRQKELQKLQGQFKKLEEKLGVSKQKKNDLEAQLADPGTYSDAAKFKLAEQEYQQAEQELKVLNEEYEVLFEKIMEMES